MNSLDPWRLIATDEFGDVVLPRPHYGHPFYSEVPSWIHYGDQNGTTRLLFDGAFIAGEAPPAPKQTASRTPTLSELVAQVHAADAAIQQTDHEMASTLGRDVSRVQAEAQSWWVNKYWRPFVAHWNSGMKELREYERGTRALGSTPLVELLVWISRMNEQHQQLRYDAGAFGLGLSPLTSIREAVKGDLMNPTYYSPYGYVGADMPASLPGDRRTGLTAELAPVVAPATGGISVKKEFDGKVLHVEICVDGKCYRTSMDLTPAIAMVMQKLARWHESLHAAQPAPSTVVSTVGAAVAAAEDAIVGALVARHIDTVCGSFLGDIAGAASSAVKGLTGGVRGIAGGVASTFRRLKGPIGAAASIAAASGAAAIPGVGPIAAPIAGKLANDIVQAASGDTKAKQAVAQANQQAKTDPAVAVALEQATKAVANATAAHHVQDTAKKAARGDSAAQQQIVKVADDAQQGDPAAKAVADLVANAMKSEWGANLWEKVTGRGPSTISGQWYDVVGAAIDDVREAARAHANTKAGGAAGVVQLVDGRLHGRGFRNLDDAIDWLQRVTRSRGTFTYAAAYEKGSDGTAYIQAEEFGTTAPQPLTPGTIPREVPATTGWW